MGAQSYADAFKEAADLAKLVPESMQAAAFDRALSLLLGDSGGATKVRAAGQSLRPFKSDGSDVSVLIAGIDRTAHPDVVKSPRVLERAMHVLRIAKDDHDTDGLTAPGIAEVLNEKFRLTTTRQAVQCALDAAGKFVDRTPSNGRVIYRLMHDGDEHLKNPGAAGGAPRTKARKLGHAQSKAASPPSTPAKEPARSRARGSGPSRKGLVEELIKDGFFSTGRTMGEMCERLSQKKGHRFQASELSPTVLRLLRDEVLDRDRNTDGQYAYRAKVTH